MSVSGPWEEPLVPVASRLCWSLEFWIPRRPHPIRSADIVQANPFLFAAFCGGRRHLGYLVKVHCSSLSYFHWCVVQDLSWSVTEADQRSFLRGNSKCQGTVSRFGVAASSDSVGNGLRGLLRSIKSGSFSPLHFVSHPQFSGISNYLPRN